MDEPFECLLRDAIQTLLGDITTSPSKFFNAVMDVDWFMETSFSFFSAVLLQFFIMFDELIFCQSICSSSRSQKPLATSGREQEMCFLIPPHLLEVVQAPSLVRLACADHKLFEFFMYVCCILMLLIPLSLILASYTLILAAVLRMQSTAARKKAFATCSSHLAVVGLFYGTLMFIYMRPKSFHSVAHDKLVSAFYTIFTPVLNPLMYSVRNKEVKGALRKWLKRYFL
ncbi:PREDICTED: olfactory receptor 2T33-like [Ceratotherium simum simum]|uniref:Olfactory receptor 2T33-like n=1 Tax=Ceratotherium simum simum TaxID=73337 RepID=A0ABM1DDR1_CERSS|nr:PREDICTED: olfactory receptor 2T33-like [Ceratotherium simum simum]